MAVLRTANFTGQQRVDVPHLRAVEAAMMADFDVVAGRTQSGGKALVVRGMAIGAYSAGAPAISLQLAVADSVVYNQNASEAGTCLWVPADRPVETLDSATNPRVSGSFVANATNYIGLDYVRSADASTTDLVKFLDADTHLEAPLNIPLARTLDYRITIGTTPFSAQPHLIPVAKVSTDASNLVVSVTDARTMLGRLGRGGDFPDAMSGFSWPQGRVEGAGTFSGGDKGLLSQKDWQDAVMSRIWEIGGGESWYSPVADRNTKMIGAPGVVFSSTADNFEWVSGLYGVNHLHWQGLRFTFENAGTAGIYYNTVTDQLTDDATGSSATSKTALGVGDCLYVDLDRTSNATVVALRASLQTLGESAVPGARIIIAWRTADGVFRRDGTFAVNTSFAPATTVALGAVRLAATDAGLGTPTVFNLDADNRLTVGGASYPVTGSTYAVKASSGASSRAIWGVLDTTTGAGEAVYGRTESSSATSYGVYGHSLGAGVGVYGKGWTSYGVHGHSVSSVGVYGTTDGTGLTHAAVMGETYDEGQYSAYFLNTAAAPSNPLGGTAAKFESRGSATTAEVLNTAGGTAAAFESRGSATTVVVTGGTGTALDVTTASTRKAIGATGHMAIGSDGTEATLTVRQSGLTAGAITAIVEGASTEAGAAITAWISSGTATGNTVDVFQDGTGKGVSVVSGSGAGVSIASGSGNALNATSTSGVACQLTGNATRGPLNMAVVGLGRAVTALPTTPADGEICLFDKLGQIYFMVYSGAPVNSWFYQTMTIGTPP